MTALTSAIDAEIEDKIRSIRQFTGGVFVGDVPDGADIPRNRNGEVDPYAVILFGGLIQTQGRFRGIVGSRENLKYHTFTVMTVGSTDRQSRLLADVVRDEIEGHEPMGTQGQITEETSGNTRYPGDSTLKPTRYAQMLMFSLLIGT